MTEARRWSERTQRQPRHAHWASLCVLIAAQQLASARNCTEAKGKGFSGFTASFKSKSEELSGEVTVVDACTLKVASLRFKGDSATVFWWGVPANKSGTEMKVSSEVLVLNSQQPPAKTIHLKGELLVGDFSEFIARDAFTKETLARVKLPSKPQDSHELGKDLEALFQILDADSGQVSAAESEYGVKKMISSASTDASKGSHGGETTGQTRYPSAQVSGRSGSEQEALQSGPVIGVRTASLAAGAEVAASETLLHPIVRAVADIEVDVDVERERQQALQQARSQGVLQARNASRKKRLPNRRMSY